MRALDSFFWGALVSVMALLIGCFVTWYFARYYYRRAQREIPDWAMELLSSLPEIPPTPSELLRIFQKYLDSGDATYNHLLGVVACPKCGTSAKDFEEKYLGETDRETGVISFTCPGCGWSETAEV